MDYESTFHKTIPESFREFHKENPAVYEHFIRLAFQAIRKGKKKLSSKMIINVIRWEIFLETKDANLFEVNGEVVKFKINDAYTAHYARLFAKDFPNHADKFEFRRIRSKSDK